MASAEGVQTAYPMLRFSFTIATLAAADGGTGAGNLNATGVATVKASTLSNDTINLMTMDYGPASRTVCVMAGNTCDMGASAIEAAKALNRAYGIPLSRIELTPMIGMNDVTDEVFTLDDVDEVAAYAKAAGLAGLHTWSLDRDTPCATPSRWASPTCHSVASGPSPLAYTNRFVKALA